MAHGVYTGTVVYRLGRPSRARWRSCQTTWNWIVFHTCSPTTTAAFVWSALDAVTGEIYLFKQFAVTQIRTRRQANTN